MCILGARNTRPLSITEGRHTKGRSHIAAVGVLSADDALRGLRGAHQACPAVTGRDALHAALCLGVTQARLVSVAVRVLEAKHTRIHAFIGTHSFPMLSPTKLRRIGLQVSLTARGEMICWSLQSKVVFRVTCF